MPFRRMLGIVGIVLLGSTAFAVGAGLQNRKPVPAERVLMSTAAGERSSLTTYGQAQLNLEELLTEEFHQGGGCAIVKSGVIDFPFNDHHCTPLSTYHPYLDLFAHAGKSAFHLTTTKYHGQNFGVYPIPILVGGRLIGCNSTDSTYVVEFGDAVNFAVGCQAPEAE